MAKIKRIFAAGEPDFAEYREELYKEHAVEIGRVVIAWNALHEELAKIFAAVITPHEEHFGFAAWHALKNDRAQRDMLKAVTLERFGENNKFAEDLLWALKQINPLEEDRNTTIHSPYTVTLDFEEHGIKFIPSYFWGHRRAKKLVGKDLKLEFESQTARFDLLKTFVNHLAAHIGGDGSDQTWPSRPRLPRPAQPMSRKARPPQNADK